MPALFEHRREAYAQFIAETNRLASAFNRHYMQGEPVENDVDPLRPTIERLALVQLYGTPESSDFATKAFSAIAQYVHRGQDDGNLVFDFQVAIEEFTRRARSDLGVSES